MVLDQMPTLATGVPAGAWVELPDHIGDHDSEAIAAAARDLRREGFLELRPGEARLRA